MFVEAVWRKEDHEIDVGEAGDGAALVRGAVEHDRLHAVLAEDIEARTNEAFE